MIQRTLKPIKKDSTNPHFRSAYFDINTLLSAIKPTLNEYDLLLTQSIILIEGRMVIETVIGDAGGEIKSGMLLPEGLDPQKLGSAITYFRRYALQSMLGLESEDDDGNNASNPLFKEPKSYGGYITTIPQKTQSEATSHTSSSQDNREVGGTCKNCSLGVYRLSKHGKLYCSNKCWLKQGEENFNEEPF